MSCRKIRDSKFGFVGNANLMRNFKEIINLIIKSNYPWDKIFYLLMNPLIFRGMLFWNPSDNSIKNDNDENSNKTVLYEQSWTWCITFRRNSPPWSLSARIILSRSLNLFFSAVRRSLGRSWTRSIITRDQLSAKFRTRSSRLAAGPNYITFTVFFLCAFLGLHHAEKAGMEVMR